MNQILYIRSKPKGESLLSKFYFRKDINISVIQNEHLNLLSFFKKNKHIFFTENKYIFIDLDYFKDKTEGRPHFQTSYWNNTLTEEEREQIIILNYNNELSLDASNLVKMKSFYREEDLEEFLQNEKLLEEERSFLAAYSEEDKREDIEEYPNFSDPYKEDKAPENKDKETEKEESQSQDKSNENNDDFQVFIDEGENEDNSEEQEKSDALITPQEASGLNIGASCDIDPFNDNKPLKMNSKANKAKEEKNPEPKTNPAEEKEEAKKKYEENKKALDNIINQATVGLKSEEPTQKVDVLPDENEFEEKGHNKNTNEKIIGLIKNPIKLKPKKKVSKKEEAKALDTIFPENLVTPYIVNVVGAKAKIGTTYTSVYLAMQAKKEGYKACVVVSEEDHKILTHKDNELKFNSIFSVTEKSKTREYDLVIYDLGAYNVNDNELMDKMFHANMKVLVVALGYPNYISQYTIERYKATENQYPVIALNFADGEDIKAFEKEYKKLTQIIPIPIRALG